MELHQKNTEKLRKNEENLLFLNKKVVIMNL